jgi:hypothetical protein
VASLLPQHNHSNYPDSTRQIKIHAAEGWRKGKWRSVSTHGQITHCTLSDIKWLRFGCRSSASWHLATLSSFRVPVPSFGDAAEACSYFASTIGNLSME